MKNSAAILCGILFVLQNSTGLEYNKQQRLNANSDFLLHEGGQTSGNKRDYVATQPSGSQPQTYGSLNGGSANYAAQFPALGPPTSQPQAIASNNVNNGRQDNTQSSNGKRDYVAPQLPTVKPIQQNNQPTGGNTHTQMSLNNQNGGRPYSDAAQFPSLGPSSPSQSHTTASNNENPLPQRNPQSTNGKRDYVAPQFPIIKPIQQNNQPNGAGGKVKDLINFYDSKNPSQGTFSYSSILQGSSIKNGPTPTVPSPSIPTTSSVHTPKPMTFSSIVAGNKPNTHSTLTTLKPTTRIPSTPISRPGTPVLPSSIVNNNRGTTNTNSVTDAELEALSEELLRKDTNNAAKYITINYQAKTTSQSTVDMAPLPLITISPEVWNIPTIEKFVPLLDNYERDTLVNEHVTPQERNEENAFMDAIMSTSVMRHLMTYLKNKGYVTPDPKQQRDFLKQLWFSLYSRGKGKISSSGFEHIFVSEFKNGGVSGVSSIEPFNDERFHSNNREKDINTQCRDTQKYVDIIEAGLHNWIYFAREESANRINYMGYLKYENLGDKGAILKFHFNQQGVDKPVNSIFLGTSPELEMALYTLCFVTRADNDCKLKLANKDVSIVTHTFRYRSKNLIGSAFPQI